jgi:hypothetical protein
MGKKIQSAGGIGESKIFCASEGSLGESGVDRILKCHVNGVQIRELNLAPQILGALDYWATDEGIAEKAARPGLVEPSGVTLGRDGWDKSLEQRKDDVLDRDMDLYEARDPFKEMADQFVKPGMRPKMLSAAKIKQGGTGDHQIVKYPEGHPQAGDPVMVRNMVLGEMPERRAIARNNHYRQKDKDLLAQVEAKHKSLGGVVLSNQD